ncbi:Metallo-dependent hydrolase [Polychaeton citri CBS 116435]|uniref:adenosine deaminase n=1 Tax=Polychaeton citri CBS 116435 TaxID=1314669 RepID=A0A9P4Q709_9PEZI|nr:Metallo-dependent hydrolase [Polychaeton citri CBS 116435]
MDANTDAGAEDFEELTLEEEDEIWAEENGVPSLDEPFIQKFLDGRDALVAQEKRQRSDHLFREALSPMAREASAIVSAIRFEEQQTLWNEDYEANLSKDAGSSTLYPGMMFTLAKKRMESSKLWQIVKRMPKGALLHCHLDATGDYEELLKHAFELNGICMRSQNAITNEEAFRTTPFDFQFVKKPPQADAVPMWSETYQPMSWVPIKKAAETFPANGTTGFKQWFLSRITITPEHALQQHLGPWDIWRKFTSCFRVVDSLHSYEPIWRLFIRRALKGFNEDGVKWVDIRRDFSNPFWQEGAEAPDEDLTNMLEIMQEEIDAFKASEEGQGFWGARLIWTSIRHYNTRAIVEDMQRCIDMKQMFPALIAGYDLVGQEDKGRSLAELTPELFWFKKACHQAGVNIPFFFHAGETSQDGGATDENLFDAILLGTRRIGHGFSLFKHPLLVDMVKDKRILLECCPISNEVLRLCSSIMQHPLPSLLARGVPCALANDDPAILGHGTNGMSHDFWQALQGWENLGLEGLASLAENSVRWAAFEDCTNAEWNQQIKDGAYGKGIRAQRIQQWTRDFEKFCQWVVLEFGPETDINTLD